MVSTFKFLIVRRHFEVCSPVLNIKRTEEHLSMLIICHSRRGNSSDFLVQTFSFLASKSTIFTSKHSTSVVKKQNETRRKKNLECDFNFLKTSNCGSALNSTIVFYLLHALPLSHSFVLFLFCWPLILVPRPKLGNVVFACESLAFAFYVCT